MNPLDLFESDDLAWLERRDYEVEGAFVERKEWCDGKTLAEQISAFANGQPPGGLIVVGVTAKGELKGLGERVGKLNEILGHHLGSRVDTTALKQRWVTHSTGAQILFVLVPFSANRVVCLSDGRAFRRQGSSTIELGTDQIAELRYARGERSFETEPIAALTDEIVDADQARAFLDGVVRRNGLTLPLTLREALANKGLVDNGTGDLNVAGLLAVGRTPSDRLAGARLRFLRFEGTAERFGTQRNVVKDRWFDGPIPRIVAEFRAFMRDTIRELDYLGPEGKFVREPEYPEVAWEEALVNALVHRSYSIRNAAVFVRMFEDRLEVESPGVFPSNARPDSEGVFPFSAPRNPKLARALQYLEIVRLAKEGTRRMHDEMIGAGLPPPKFEEVASAKVVVTLFNDFDRRRARLGIEEATQQWGEIAPLLRSDLAIYRRRAMEIWRQLIARGALPPTALVQDATLLLRSGHLPLSERQEIAKLLAEHPDEVLTDVARFITDGLLNDEYGEGRTDLKLVVIGIIARSDDEIERLLRWVESSAEKTTAVLDSVFSVILRRLRQPPLPSRTWLDRIVNLAAQYHKVAGAAGAVFAEITGQHPQTS